MMMMMMMMIRKLARLLFLNMGVPLHATVAFFVYFFFFLSVVVVVVFFFFFFFFFLFFVFFFLQKLKKASDDPNARPPDGCLGFWARPTRMLRQKFYSGPRGALASLGNRMYDNIENLATMENTRGSTVKVLSAQVQTACNATGAFA